MVYDNHLPYGGGAYGPHQFFRQLHMIVESPLLCFGTLLVLHETFQKMPTLPPGSRDKFAEVSTFWGMSAKNSENWRIASLIFPGDNIFPRNRIP